MASMMTGDLLGRYHVTAETRGKGFRFTAPAETAFAAPRPKPAPGEEPVSLGAFEFEPLPPEEAIAFFRDKLPLTRSAFDAVTDAYRARAFTIAFQQEERAVGVVQGFLQKTLDTGGTLAEFRRDLDEAAAAGGILAVNPYHAETVFRTNVQTAYNAGRYEMYQAEGMEEFFPFFQYHTVGDDRVRPAHEQMNGFVARRDDPVWTTWWPPNGFNCRCTVTAISNEEAEAEGIRVSRREVPEPDAGFAGNAARDIRAV